MSLLPSDDNLHHGWATIDLYDLYQFRAASPAAVVAFVIGR
jgi:hypothetical protein